MTKRRDRLIHLIAFIALVANLFAPVLTLPVTAEDLVSDQPVVTTNNEETETNEQQSDDDAAAEEAARQQAEADAEATREAEEAAAKKAAEEEAARIAAEEEAARIAAEEEAARIAAEEEAARIAAEEEAARIAAEEEAAKEEAAKKEAADKAAEEEVAKEEAAKKEAADKAAEEEAAKKEAADKAAEEEAAKDEAAKKEAEEEAQRTEEEQQQLEEEKSETTLAPLNQPMAAQTLPAISPFTAQGNGTDWMTQFAGNDARVCGEVLTFRVIAQGTDAESPYTYSIEFGWNGPHRAHFTNISVLSVTGGTLDQSALSGSEGTNGLTLGFELTTDNDGGEVIVLIVATITCLGAPAQSPANLYAMGPSDIPVQVDRSGNGDPEECALVQGQPNDNCDLAKLPTVEIEHAVCMGGQDQPSTLTITDSVEGGFRVSLVQVVPGGEIKTLIPPDGYGEYTFNNTSTITVRIQLTLDQGFYYQVQTQGNPWLPGGGNWPGNGEYVLGGTTQFKYQEVELKYTPCPDLEIEKVEDTTLPDGTVGWKITVLNEGRSQERVRVVETSPDGTSNWTMIGNGCDAPAQVSGMWTWICEAQIASATQNGPGKLEYTFKSTGTLICQDYVNTATLYYRVGTQESYQWVQAGSSSSTFEMECEPDLSIKKKLTTPASGNTVNPGATIAFKVTVTNSGSGPATAGSFAVVDTLPGAIPASSWTFTDGFGCVADDVTNTITCDDFAVPADDESVDIYFSATVPIDGSVCGKLTNSVELELNEQVPDNGDYSIQTSTNNPPKTTDSDWVKVECKPKVKIEKSAKKSVQPGSTLTYTITVTNTGNTLLSGYVMTDELSPLVQFLEYVDDETANACERIGSVVTCDVRDLNPKSGNTYDSQTFTIAVLVTTDLTPQECKGKIENTASVAAASSNGQPGPTGPQTVTNPGGVSDSSTVKTSLDCKPKVEIKKKGASKVDPGGEFTYTITVKNSGNVDLKNIVVKDTVPSGLTIQGVGQGCDYAGQVVTCNIANLTAGSSVDFTIDVKATTDPTRKQCSDDLVNIAKITDHNFWKKNQKAIESKQVKTDLKCKPDIEVTKTDNLQGKRVEPATPFTYTITVENTGNIPLTDIVLTDLLPSDLTFVSWVEQDGMPCDAEAPNCTISSLGVGEKVTITFEVEFNTNLSHRVCENGVTNKASATAKSAGGKVDDSDRQTSKPKCRPSVDLEKTAESSTVEPGGYLVFYIVFTNTGNIDVANATITDPLPALPDGVEWEVTRVGNAEELVSFPYPVSNLKPEGTVELVARAQVPAELELDENVNPWCTLWENTAKVSGKYSNNKTFWKSDSADIQVNCTGVHIVKNGPTEVLPGDSFDYTIVVTNMGNTTVNNIDVTDELDSRLTINSAFMDTPSGVMDCDVADQLVNCLIPSLGEGQVATITINVTVIATPDVEQCDALLQNFASIVSINETDQVLYSAQSIITIPQEFPVKSNTWDTEIRCSPDLDLEKTVAASEVVPGEDIVFTITASNTGTYPVYDETIVDSLPAGLAGMEWDIALTPDDTDTVCERVDDDIVCEPVALDAYDGQLVITLAATTNASEPVCGLYTNTVAMGELEATADVDVLCEPNYEVEKTSANTDDVEPLGVLSVGDTLTYTVTVMNTGNLPLTGITLDDQFSGSGEGGLTWTAPDGFDGENVPDIAVGSSIDLVATYVITQDDVDAGEIENCAFMTYQVDEDTVIERDDCATDDIDQEPVYDVVKTSAMATDADDNQVLSAGDTLQYTITVTNTGNLTLTGITLDDQFSGSGEGGLTWIAPEGFDGVAVPDLGVGDSFDLVATYVITQDDVDAGQIENCAFMTYQVDEETVIKRDDCVTDEFRQGPGVSLVKTGTLSDGAEVLVIDNTITYVFTVTNTGNVTVNNLEIDDPMEGVTFDDGNTIASLAPGASIELTATYTVVQADVNVGMIVNCADVHGMAADGTEVSANSCDTKQVEQDLDIMVAQECPGPVEGFRPQVGESVTLLMTITNTGTVTVFGVEVTTSRDGTFNEPFPTTLEPGQTETRQWTIVATQEDYDAREIVVEVSVAGDAANGFNAMQASMAMMQDIGDSAENTLMFSCPMDELLKPKPDPEKPVAKLPDTGVRSATSTASVLLAAAIMSTFVLGASALGIRRSSRR